MRASSRKSGDNFLPVIVHDDGRRETLHGPPLTSRATAEKYARLEIADRQKR